tara:strand:+ start:660 stop:995 length:336 start_codon:yes stop_codon:yes gene_type:complete
MVKRPGTPVRGSATGRPIMVLLDVLGQRWTLRILWELRGGPATFRALQARCDAISPTVLNARLKDLRALALVTLAEDGYALSRLGEDLCDQFGGLDAWANQWAETANLHVD